MVEKPSEFAKFLPIPMEPRKIMLEKQSKKKVTLEPTSTDAVQNGTAPSEEKTHEKANQTRREDVAQMGLLDAIASYLKKNGFSKTLSAFLSEAQLEVDGWKAHSFDLEDLICKQLVTSYSNEPTRTELKEQASFGKTLKTSPDSRLAETADLQIDSLAGKNKEEGKYDASGKSSHSKKRKKSNGSDAQMETESNKLENENGNLDLIADPSQNLDKSLREFAKHVKESTEILLNDELIDMNLKSKEKKKKKKKKKKLVLESAANSKELGTEVDLEKMDAKKVKSASDITDHEILLGGPPIKSKEKKNKKHKLISDSCAENIEQASPETNQEVVNEKSKELKSSLGVKEIDSRQPEILEGQSPVKSKEKKSKKLKLISDSHAENIEQVSSETNKEVAKEKSKNFNFLQGGKRSDSQQPESAPETDALLDGTHFKSKEKKKKHKLTPEGLNSEISEKTGLGTAQNGDKQISKDLGAVGCFNDILSHLKTNSNEIKSDVDNSDHEILLGGSHAKSKEKKNKKHKLISQENEEVEGQLHQNKRRKVVDHTKIKECLDQFEKGSKEKATDAPVDKNPEEEKQEGSASTKTVKKEANGFSEPKTVNAFRRVKLDEVKFANERLQDNSYWAKSGADNGYGAKAQEVLGQVRGKDFRHEKTKKKRGSYKGGHIDLQSHSIKFNDSDEE